MKKGIITKFNLDQIKKLSRSEMKLIMAGSADDPGDGCKKANGRATTSSTCSCSIDKEKSTSDTTLCCLSC
jgi:hypothetical protein